MCRRPRTPRRAEPGKPPRTHSPPQAMVTD
jgi:hypothetical protein